MRRPQMSPYGGASAFQSLGSGGTATRSLRTLLSLLPTSRETTRLSRGTGWGVLPSEEKVPANKQSGTKAPHAAPCVPSERRERVKSPVSAGERVRGGVAPVPLQGAGPCDLSPEAAGLSAESEGGSRGPGAATRLPGGPRGETPARP